jgi:hypothetical protein
MVPRIIVCWAASGSAKLWGTTRALPWADLFRPLRGKIPMPGILAIDSIVRERIEDIRELERRLDQRARVILGIRQGSRGVFLIAAE